MDGEPKNGKKDESVIERTTLKEWARLKALSEKQLEHFKKVKFGTDQSKGFSLPPRGFAEGVIEFSCVDVALDCESSRPRFFSEYTEPPACSSTLVKEDILGLVVLGLFVAPGAHSPPTSVRARAKGVRKRSSGLCDSDSHKLSASKNLKYSPECRF